MGAGVGPALPHPCIDAGPAVGWQASGSGKGMDGQMRTGADAGGVAQCAYAIVGAGYAGTSWLGVAASGRTAMDPMPAGAC